MRLGRCSLAICGWLLAVPAVCRAQADDTPPEAVEFFRLAREDYAAGRYREAADGLERALVLDPDSSTLVFNLARVYELLGNLPRAVEFYERYQQLLPHQQAQEQERSEATLRRLRGAQESLPGDQEGGARPHEVQPLMQLPGLVLVRENGDADGIFWAVLTTGVASLAIGGILGGVAIGSRSGADSYVLGRDGSAQQRSDLYGDAQTFALTSDITLSVGGVAVLVAGLLYFLRERTVERAPVRAVEEGEDGEEAPSIEPTAGASASGAFAGVTGTF